MDLATRVTNIRLLITERLGHIPTLQEDYDLYMNEQFNMLSHEGSLTTINSEEHSAFIFDNRAFLYDKFGSNQPEGFLNVNKFATQELCNNINWRIRDLQEADRRRVDE